MAIEFTPQQQLAIDSRGCHLIVSAAAGSGKTAVLVERVIGRICDPKDPCGVDELLVVTFTNAAAAEMQEKISAALYRRLTQSPGDLRLRRQLALLPAARIQTVHSFCLDLVRENFALCGVPADFAVADQARVDELRAQAMEEVLEELYAAAEPGFAALCRALAEEKGDRLLSDTISEIYDKLMSHPDPRGMLERFTSAEGQSLWRETLLREAEVRMEDADGALRAAAEALRQVPELREKYGPAFEACRTFSAQAQAAIEEGWDAAFACFHAFSNPRLAAVRGFSDQALLDYLKNAKNAFAEAVGEIREQIFFFRESQAAAFAGENLLALDGLRRAVLAYMERYSALKLRRGLLDFSDLEHYALGLLQTPEGEPSALALEISEGLREVLVDEYQDTNEIQDTIFSMLTTRAGGSFYVGDVKQSIYRFRMAKPEIFMEKYLHYRPLEPGMTGEKARLSLNRNFRSRPEVLAVCNHVFRACMSRAFGDVDYTEEEALYPGAPYTGAMQSHLEIIDMAGADMADEEDAPAKIEAEAICTANTIADMLRTETVTDPFTGTRRPAEPEDFAILLSSFANKSGYFIRELERLDIPCTGGRRDFWHSMEILVVLSFLRVLDNRRQDIPLIGLLRSPLFFFTADDLADIRLADPQGCFFDALQRHAEAGHEKSAAFCRMLARYADYVPDLSPADLLRMLYTECAIPAVFGAMDGGAERRQNLRRFYEMALSWSSGGHRGLFEFLLYIEKRMEKDDPGEGGDSGAGVRVMSIHKSKGLEFPFVFLPDLNKTFNFDDARRQVVMHDQLGIGLRLRVPETHIEYRTPMHLAISAATRRELASEEMRKLYVAMTRAREKLILVMGLRDAQRTIDEIKSDLRGCGITPGWLSRRSNAAAWLLAAFLQSPCPALTIGRTPVSSIERHPAHGGMRGEAAKEAASGQDYGDLLAMMDAPYPYAAQAALPSKLTPKGTRRLLEPDAAQITGTDGKAAVEFFPSDRKPVETGLTAARRGSLIHLALQKADLTACGSRGDVLKQIDALCAAGLLTPEEAKTIEPDMILGFAQSPWGRRLPQCRQVIREYEFSTLFSPKELGLLEDETEEILMNGVIDLLLVEEEGLTVIDFKSDRIAPGTEAQAVLRHKLQVDIYAQAAQKIFGLPVREKLVFFLRTGRGQPV
ncbi:MAG: UvrD-helicase domain-containing protein [Butyricicoccaceae bacterium]